MIWWEMDQNVATRRQFRSFIEKWWDDDDNWMGWGAGKPEGKQGVTAVEVRPGALTEMKVFVTADDTQLSGWHWNWGTATGSQEPRNRWKSRSGREGCWFYQRNQSKRGCIGAESVCSGSGSKQAWLVIWCSWEQQVTVMRQMRRCRVENWGRAWNNLHSSREEQAEQTVTRSGLNVLVCGSDFTSVNSTRKHHFLCKGWALWDSTFIPNCFCQLVRTPRSNFPKMPGMQQLHIILLYV